MRRERILPALRVNDPRRLGRSTLDADLDHLGVDIFSVDANILAEAVNGRRAAIKTVLLDQTVIAGLGNLCADEVLWWAGVAPQRPVGSLTEQQVDSIATAIVVRLPIMLKRGGSTMGELSPTQTTNAWLVSAGLGTVATSDDRRANSCVVPNSSKVRGQSLQRVVCVSQFA